MLLAPPTAAGQQKSFPPCFVPSGPTPLRATVTAGVSIADLDIKNRKSQGFSHFLIEHKLYHLYITDGIIKIGAQASYEKMYKACANIIILNYL